MSESPIPITPGSGGASVASDLVSGNNYQQIKVVDGALGSINAWKINTDGSAQVSVIGTISVSVIGAVPVTFAASSNQSVSGTVGASIIGTVPVTGFPANQSVSGTIGASIIGIVPVALYTTPGSIVSGVTSVITGTASVLVLAAPTGVQRNYVTQLLVTNGAATATFVDVVDNGAIIYSGQAAASGGGFSASFPVPLKQPSVASGLYVTTRSQASVIVSASGYTAP